MQPASRKICARDRLPMWSECRSSYTLRVAGTRNVGTDTTLFCKMRAAATKSSVLPPGRWGGKGEGPLGWTIGGMVVVVVVEQDSRDRFSLSGCRAQDPLVFTVPYAAING
jgi:hypothetical protein